MGVITHAMVSGKADGPNTSFVQPSDWDAPHVVSDIGTADLGDDITAAGKALLDDATAADQLTTLGVSAFAQTVLDDADAATARTTLGAAAAADIATLQPLDATLTALAGLDATAGLVEQTAADTFAKRALGVGASTSVLTRADGDGRYSLTSHDHTGRWLARQEFTSGSGTVTSNALATRWHVRMIGGGGGGGGVGGGAGIGAGGGGNSGWYIEFWVTVDPNTGYSYSIGTAGTAGATTPTAGGAGGDTTLGPISAVTYTAKGGTGGTAATKATQGSTGPNVPAAGSSAVTILHYGEGGLGLWWSSTLAVSGNGGETPLGVNGYAVSTGNGIAGTNGGGGSGGASTTSASGGAGGAGLIIIDEYT